MERSIYAKCRIWVNLEGPYKTSETAGTPLERFGTKHCWRHQCGETNYLGIVTSQSDWAIRIQASLQEEGSEDIMEEILFK